jgi:hypothetical protein
MSAYGTKRTFKSAELMSAFDPKRTSHCDGYIQPENEARWHLGNIPCGIQDLAEPLACVTAFGGADTVRWWGTE